MTPRWLRPIIVVVGLLAISALSVWLYVVRSKADARKLLTALASISVGASTEAEVESLQSRFHRYQVAAIAEGGVKTVRFVITNQPLAKLGLSPLTMFAVWISVRDGKISRLDASFGRQSVSAIVFESASKSISCSSPYCVGNPIGKPFVVTHIAPEATREQKDRAFNFDTSWLTRLSRDTRICDLAPHAWQDWKAQQPDLVEDLQATYRCP